MFSDLSILIVSVSGNFLKCFKYEIANYLTWNISSAISKFEINKCNFYRVLIRVKQMYNLRATSLK